MKCVHIDIRKACFILLSLMTQYSHMLDNENMVSDSSTDVKDSHDKADDKILPCISKETSCSELIPSCFNCNLTNKCVYGKNIKVKCEVNNLAQCKGTRIFEKHMLCQYCYQTEPWQHTCDLKADCHSVLLSKSIYQTNCTVHDDILCLGLHMRRCISGGVQNASRTAYIHIPHTSSDISSKLTEYNRATNLTDLMDSYSGLIGQRKFNKNLRCNWTRGYCWSTTLVISIGLGGFGADRFYLGHWQEGIGKLFSFGGLGVWTLIDVILIALHYLGPADGSLYI